MRAMSSSPRTTMRSLKCPSEKREAIDAACRTGSTTCLVTIHAIAAESRISASPAVMIVFCMMPSVCSSALSGNTR